MRPLAPLSFSSEEGLLLGERPAIVTRDLWSDPLREKTLGASYSQSV